MTTEHPLDGNLSLFHPSGCLPGGYFMAAQHPLDREFALFHQADFLSGQRHFFELSERILQALQTAALVFHHGRRRRQQLQWRRNHLELAQRLVQTQQTARMQRQAKLALRQRPHQMQTIHVHDFGRLDRDHAVGVPGPGFELPSVLLVVSTIVRMAWTFDRRQTHTIEHPRLQFLAPIRSCRCRRRRACTTSRVRSENPVPVGSRGDPRLARDERHGAVMVGRSAELARQALVLVIVRQDEAEMRSQPAVVVDGVVGVGNVEEELPGFRRGLGKGFAAVEAVEAVVGRVGGERHYC